MKQILLITFLGIAIHFLPMHASSPKEKYDTLVVVDDSLDCYRYQLSDITLLVGNKPELYTVVFDSIKQYLRPCYQQIGGSVYPYNAIKNYGAKYRKGILIYQESEVVDE